MGPGYMPTILCWLLIALGGLIALKDLFVTGEDVQLGRIRPFVLVLASVAVFALTIESLAWRSRCSPPPCWRPSRA